MNYLYTYINLLTLIVINLSVDLGMFLDTLIWAPDASYEYTKTSISQQMLAVA